MAVAGSVVCMNVALAVVPPQAHHATPAYVKVR